MSEIEGYKIVPLRLSPDAKNCHSIFMREHYIRLMDPNKPKGRTLFLLNVPPYVTEESLKRFFNSVGKVEFVTFALKPGKEETQKWQEESSNFCNMRPPFKFKVAYVVFKSSSSLGKALDVPSIDLFNKGNGECTFLTGVELWHSTYKSSILDEKTITTKIEKYMAEYDERERIAQEEAKTTEADPEGWVTVGKRGHNAGFQKTETVVNKLEEKIEKSKKKKELTNFYTFQIRESKMKNIIELRQKFEEDKEKIELLKKARRFKPF